MPDAPPPPPAPPKPRGLLMMTLMTVAILVLVLLVVRDGGGLGGGAETPSYSAFLDNVREGKVSKFRLGVDAIHVEASPDGGGKNYTVLYPGARLSDEVKREVNEAVAANNDLARVANSNGGRRRCCRC
jgi:hypothetical protein